MLPRLGRLAAVIGLARVQVVLVACGVLVGLSLLVESVLVLVEQRQNDASDTGRVLNNLSLILGEQANQALQAVEFVQTLTLIALGGIAFIGLHHLRGYAKLKAALAAQAHAEVELAVVRKRCQALQGQSANFDSALGNMHQALCMYDHSSRVLLVNRRFSELFALADEAIAPGTQYEQIAERVIAAGVVTAEEMREVREWRNEAIDRRERTIREWDLANGQTILVTHQPMQNGWLSTYEDVTERRQAEARIEHMAHHDALTNLPNRKLFRQRLDNALAYARRGHMLALLCLDLDQFKSVNDTLGHPVGDSLLRAVAQRLTEQSRETDTVARLGGDEFAIVQMGISKAPDATALAGRLIEILGEPFEVDGHRIVIGTSIGIAFAPQDGVDPDQLLRCADLALYRAKVDGRGVYRLFHAEMDAQMQARRLLELDLRQAMRAGEFALFYQPLVDLHSKAVAGFEGLLRWRHPRRGIVPPNEFVPLAEEIGLIVQIGEWVLRQACLEAASWPAPLKVAVNLSPAQFRSRKLVSAVATALSASSLSPDRLELEITETVMLQDTDATLATLHELHALGVRIAMDDFGTGYSSLSYLRRFPFDRIKIDQSFVRELGRREDCSAIVRAVAGLSSELGMQTTAEGVETQEQLEALSLVGCSEVQGYLFSPAIPGSEVVDLLSRMRAVARVKRAYTDAASTELVRA